MAELSTVRRNSRALVALFGAIALLLLSTLFTSASADAATTDNAQLSLTGVVDGNNPTGGSDLGIHPGTTVKFTASAAPTQKVKDLVDSLGLGGLLDSLLSTVTFQVKADFSHLPGGHKDTVLSGNNSASFSFPHTGTYSFSYEAEKVTVGLLGKSIAPINLNGNQAKQAGVELNASNNYVGHIVVSDNPKNGISVQLPSVNVHPKVAGHNLPSVNLPGVTTPKVRVSVPDITNPIGGGKTTSPKPGAGGPGASGGGSTGTNPTQQLPVPTRVMGSVSSGSSYYGGGGGFYGESVGGNNSTLNSALPATGNATAAGGGAGKTAGKHDATHSKRAADLAENRAPSAQLPLVLAILAVVALSLVTATYARLFLLRRHSAS